MSTTPSPQNGNKRTKLPRVATLATGPKASVKEQNSSLANGAFQICRAGGRSPSL